MVFLDTGVRLSELVGIEVDDVRDNKIVIRRTKILFERVVYLLDTTKEQLKRYITIRGNVETDKLFINDDENELKPHSIQTRFYKYSNEANITKRVSPHTFRHTMAKRMIMVGVDVFTLMTILSHSDMTITKRYNCSVRRFVYSWSKSFWHPISITMYYSLLFYCLRNQNHQMLDQRFLQNSSLLLNLIIVNSTLTLH